MSITRIHPKTNRDGGKCGRVATCSDPLRGVVVKKWRQNDLTRSAAACWGVRATVFVGCQNPPVRDCSRRQDFGDEQSTSAYARRVGKPVLRELVASFPFSSPLLQS